MEFVAYGRRDIRFSCEEEEQDEDSKKSSSSSSSSNNGGRWGLRLDGGDGPSASLPVPVPVPVEKEHMFDKVVTPSDVGKLNRLVIPKQHAEKYFPLDASGNEKGLLLSFEDRNGKPWRFRYSYWNSSQSYVMTKGWSRFVKEKRLDAGDTVSFGRGVGQTGQDRLFIDWKPRPQLPIPGGATHYQPFVSFARSPPGPWGSRVFVPPPAVYEHNRQIYGCNSMSPGSVSVSGGGGQYLYFRSPQIGVQPGKAPMVLDSLPVVNSKASAKRVRLFGVNLDCPELGCSDDNGSVPLQMVPELQPRSSIPSLQLRLGGVESSIAATHSEKQKSHLDLDL